MHLPSVIPAQPPARPGETASSGPALPSRLATPAAGACAEALLARTGGASALATALQASRRDTLALFATFEQALPGLRVAQRAELNPPLWELGHIGWFQDFWLARNPQRAMGPRADPDAPRAAARRADADALYNSSWVPHDSRWALPLPGADATRAELAAQLADSLALLATLGGQEDGGSAGGSAGGAVGSAAGSAVDQSIATDDTLYFFRLALLHEDMHHEAALYMAQHLGIAIDDPRWQAAPLPEPPPPCHIEPGPWRLGSDPGAGFAFDNELGAHDVALGATTLDAQVVRWAEYLPFVDAGGYDDERWWTDAGRAWRADQPHPIGLGAPRYLRRTPDAGGNAAGRSACMAAPPGNAWQHWRHGRWQALDLRQPACHLTHHEAQAWCRWAGRRLPAEAEWERAALSQPALFRWGDVWEWTASPFAPFPGFVPHPYRDYSAPWFDGRPVLRGASFMTQPRLRHPRYRNYFPAGRNDVPAGFRSCAR